MLQRRRALRMVSEQGRRDNKIHLLRTCMTSILTSWSRKMSDGLSMGNIRYASVHAGSRLGYASDVRAISVFRNISNCFLYINRFTNGGRTSFLIDKMLLGSPMHIHIVLLILLASLLAVTSGRAIGVFLTQYPSMKSENLFSSVKPKV